MRPQLMRLVKEPQYSFTVSRNVIPSVNSCWHYHHEVELIHFKTGQGTQFIGDSIKSFKDGDVVLVGSNLPHFWRFDDVYLDENVLADTDVRVAHFCENFWGSQFLELPENITIKSLLDKAKRGLQVTGNAQIKVAALVETLLNSSNAQRIILLMEVLNIIASSKDLEPLSSIGFNYDVVKDEKDRINMIYEYSLKNFKRPILLEEIAGVANISPSSFCRYFKSKTSKTYTQFLIEIRVSHACKLLIENNLSIKQLCYESGFNNFTSFHKYFKLITSKSPLIYQKEFMGKLTA
ncbi:AraC family transcriptional regulator [Lacibacter sp. H375]|uniref:AraC family transcriptional regulator n=1 Tax=Lacibacter sp. H375 TaxID=3133424 RepID=UPI0030C5EE95